MKVVIVTNQVIPPQKAYGGTDRVVYWLIKGLLAMRECELVLISRKGSEVIDGVRCIHVSSADEAERSIPPDPDVVHFHGWVPPTINNHSNWFCTLHGNEPNTHTLASKTCCISADHARRHDKNIFVYNGVDPSEFVYAPEEKNDSLLFFSKIRRRSKGASEAVRLACKFDIPLIMAGGYWFDLIKVGGLFSALVGRVSVIGEIDGPRKAEVFAKASALLFPIEWDEPFGLVMVEALLSGTPVIAKPRGSVSEIVNEEIGAVFTTDAEFLKAVKYAASIDPSKSREYALANFSHLTMAKNYLNLYRKISSKEEVAW